MSYYTYTGTLPITHFNPDEPHPTELFPPILNPTDVAKSASSTSIKTVVIAREAEVTMAKPMPPHKSWSKTMVTVETASKV